MFTTRVTVTSGNKEESRWANSLVSPLRRVVSLGSPTRKSPLGLTLLLAATAAVLLLSSGVIGASIVHQHILDSCQRDGTLSIAKHTFSCKALKGGAR